MSSRKTLVTADELLRLPDDGYRYELIEGELFKMPPGGAEHGGIAAKVAHRLLSFVEAHPLGVVLGAETGFWLRRDPDTVRAKAEEWLRGGARLVWVVSPDGLGPRHRGE